MTVTLIINGEPETIPKSLEKGLEKFKRGGRDETIQTTAWLTFARILRKVLEPCGDSDSNERPLVNVGVKN